MSFRRILAEIGDPEIYCLEPGLFVALMRTVQPKYELKDCYGAAEVYRGLRIVTVADGVRGWARYGTLWHEVSHHVWPNAPEWWARCTGYVLAHRRGGLGTAEYLFGHTIENVPPRRVLIERARRQVARMVK